MIVELADTTTNEVAKRIVRVREAGGAVSLGRVLTLVVCAEHGEPTEGAIEAAIGASREHPSRVIVVSGDSEDDAADGDYHVPPRLDAEIRVGGDAGASEVVVLTLQGDLAYHPRSVVTPFLLPDTPVVTWWPGEAPAHPAADEMGTIGHRRILDARHSPRPDTVLLHRLATYTPGDSDLAWTQITQWRAVLASAVDRPPHTRITSVQVTGPAESPSVDLLAGWLRASLDVPTTRRIGSFEVRLTREDGPTVLALDPTGSAILSTPGKPDGRVPVAPRELPVLLSEELRRLDTDEIYEQALHGAADIDFEEVTV